MNLCTNLQTRVLDLEKTKTTQAKEIVSLKRRVKKLEQKKRFRTHGLKRLYKVSLTARVESSKDEESLGDEVSAATTTTTATLPTPRKGIVITELGTSITTTKISSQSSQAKVQDKGKEKMIEPEKHLKKKDQLKLDEEIALKLQSEIDEEERLTREKDEANFTTEQKATLFKEVLEQRIKHFATKRAEDKRNKPPTKAQRRKTMITYLKNMEGCKDLKSKDFYSIKELFDKAFKRVNMFVDYRTDLVEGSLKRVGDELEREVTKKQNVDDVQETTEVDDGQEATKIKAAH
ncbi:hypothetical protein Tco_0678354 [Tanacetum coccineum]|uniref:Uncharacterized protein n=1 Tax=Tanacetum coccineum TaxID=301880 RepID=A0ABQ4XG01_9ASTR